MKPVRAKKKLGQHFLKDLSIAAKIAETLRFDTYEKVLEIGPGMGVLTQYLPFKKGNVNLIEIDRDSITYLKNKIRELQNVSNTTFCRYVSKRSCRKDL